MTPTTGESSDIKAMAVDPIHDISESELPWSRVRKRSWKTPKAFMKPTVLNKAREAPRTASHDWKLDETC